MSTPTPLAAIEALLNEKRTAREALDADISALERTRRMLLKSVELEVNYGTIAATLKTVVSVVEPSINYPVQPSPGAWHDAALRVFQDGQKHTTAEIYEVAKASVGTELGYSAVASWLNRMAERGALQKDGRGEFSRPSAAPPREKLEKTSEEDVADTAQRVAQILSGV